MTEKAKVIKILENGLKHTPQFEIVNLGGICFKSWDGEEYVSGLERITLTEYEALKRESEQIERLNDKDFQAHMGYPRWKDINFSKNE